MNKYYYNKWKSEGKCVNCGRQNDTKFRIGRDGPIRSPLCQRCREKRRNVAKQRKLEKRCTHCGCQVTWGAHCDKCRMKANDISNLRCEVLKNKGICITCRKKPSVTNHTICEECRQYKNRMVREYNDKRKEKGLCRSCNNPAVSGRWRCEECQKKSSDIIDSLMNKRRVEGLCMRCGNPDILLTPGGGFKSRQDNLCQQCYLKQTARNKFNLKSAKHWRKLLYLWEKQGPICPLSGKQLILGVNTSLDHIIPRSKGGTSDLSNLRWVYSCGDYNINIMRGAQSDEEFRQHIEELHKWFNLSSG